MARLLVGEIVDQRVEGAGGGGARFVIIGAVAPLLSTPWCHRFAAQTLHRPYATQGQAVSQLSKLGLMVLVPIAHVARRAF